MKLLSFNFGANGGPGTIAAKIGALSPRKGNAATRSAGGGVKSGQPLGTIVSAVTDPLTVEVVPGTGDLVLHTDTGSTGTLFSKLSGHCIDALPTGSPRGSHRSRLRPPIWSARPTPSR